MPRPLSDFYTPDEINQMMRSWAAFSAANLIFAKDPLEPLLLLGLRKQPAAAIPEPGDYAIIGGFNTLIDGPASLADIANAHAEAQLGIRLMPQQCSDFLSCEYDMNRISEPLNTPFGPLTIKRIAFDRLVFINENQARKIEKTLPEGSKLKGLKWLNQIEFTALENTGQLSFPYEVERIQQGFAFARQGYLPAADWR